MRLNKEQEKALRKKYPDLNLVAPARSKYGNKKAEYAGIIYASQLEAKTAAELDLLVLAGIVTRWERQVRFDLGFSTTYVADFVAHYPEGRPQTIDSKGVETQVFKLKRRMFEARYGPLVVIKSPKELPLEGRKG